MVGAKDVRIKPIPAGVARAFIREHHYSHKCVNNSQVHVGAFLDGNLEGVMQFGPPLDRSKILPLVSGSDRTNMLELNRMAFTDRLPRNSESRCIRVAMRILGRHKPSLKWVISFADATQCGDGTIYRASGFLLTGIKPNDNLARLPDAIGGGTVHKMTLESSPSAPRDFLGGRSYFDVTDGRYDWRGFCDRLDATILPGFQIRYIGFIDRSWRDRMTVPELPYSTLDDAHARMYRGERL